MFDPYMTLPTLSLQVAGQEAPFQSNMSSRFDSGRILKSMVCLTRLTTPVYLVISFVYLIYYLRNANVAIARKISFLTFNNDTKHDATDDKMISEHGTQLIRSRPSRGIRVRRDAGYDGNAHAYSDTDQMRWVTRINHLNGFNITTEQPGLFARTPFGEHGNNMFQVAAVVALARQTGHTPALYPAFFSFMRYFPNLHIQVGVASPNHKMVHEAAFAKFSHPLKQKISKNDTVICCYFQSWKYFSGYFKEIKAMFSFPPKAVRIANETLMKVRAQHPGAQLVGIHVRRMSRPDDCEYGAGYVIRAMDYFRRRYKKIHFIICGVKSALGWSMRFLPSRDVTFNVHDNYVGNILVDMALLSSCDHMIMTVGTYGWWAAFLGEPGREVVYFPQPYMPTSTFGKDFKAEDHFLPEWIPLW